MKNYDLLDRSRLQLALVIPGFASTPETCICYDNVPLWLAGESMDKCDFFVSTPEEEGEGFTLVCVDSYEDWYTYGEWQTLAELEEWLRNPTVLY